MTSSVVITLKSGRAVADAQRFLKDTTDPRGECRALQHLFERLGAGLEPGSSFDVQTAAAAPVRATNTLTLTYASIADQDTVVVAGTTLTCVTGTPSGAQFKKLTNATVTAGNLVTLINAHATLKLLMKASNLAGVVTMTLHTPGVIGNQVPLVGSTGMVVGAATFASGAGGIETAAVNYSRGL